jgi:alkylation response protein AidB-like acyl-CoA dehydrogenase
MEYKKGGSFLIEESKVEEVQIPEDFDSELKMFAKTARDFVEKEVWPKNDEIENQNFEIVKELMRKAGEKGLLMVDIPEKYEGMGLNKTSSTLVAEEIARAGSFAVTQGAHTGIGTLPIVFFGTEEQKKKYLPKLGSGEWIGAYCLTEPNSGSDALAAKATAVLDESGDYYILNGTKQFITNGAIAQSYIVFAKVDGEHFTAFIVDRDMEGLEIGPEEKKLGIKGSSTTQVILNEVKVPKENLLGEIGKGHLIAFNILNIGRFKLGAAAVGASKLALEESVKFGKQRYQFKLPLVAFGAIKEKIANMATKIYGAESATYRTVGLIDEILEQIDENDPEYNAKALQGIEEYAVECSIIKVYGSEVGDYCVDENVQIHGGYGYCQEYPAERHYRDSKINLIFEGTNEINRLLIPGMLFRRAMKGQLPLLQAGQKLIDDLLSGNLMMMLQEDESKIDTLKRIVENAKKMCLFVTGAAAQKFGKKIISEQEIVMRGADMISETYIMESALLRAIKMIDKVGQEDAEIYLNLAEALIYEGIEKMHLWGRQALSSVEQGDMLRTQLTMLRKFTRFQPIDLIHLKRKIADYFIDKEAYVLHI